MTKRDDFPLHVKETLAKRVGVRCSNPNCRLPTSGPKEDTDKALNVGFAAHITGATSRGPRYESSLTSLERGGIDNGIWLCGTCSKLIDSDVDRYHVDLLRAWKRLSEEAARLAIEMPRETKREIPSDVELIAFYVQAFDRPVFQDRFHQEGSMEAFEKAIDDTIVAVNTGSLRDRNGKVLQRAKGKAYVLDKSWQEELGAVVDMLRAIKSRYKAACKSGVISISTQPDGNEFYIIRDHAIADWIDETRAQIISAVSDLAARAGMGPLSFLRPYRR